MAQSAHWHWPIGSVVSAGQPHTMGRRPKPSMLNLVVVECRVEVSIIVIVLDASYYNGTGK